MLVGDNIVGDVQAQTRANARALSRKEGVKDASLNLGWDPWPVVDNFDPIIMKRANAGIAGISPVATSAMMISTRRVSPFTSATVERNDTVIFSCDSSCEPGNGTCFERVIHPSRAW